MKAIVNTRLMMGESLPLKCCPWLFIRLSVNLFNFLLALASAHENNTVCGSSFPARGVEKRYLRRERILMDKRDGSCPCRLLLPMLEVPAPDHRDGLAICLFWVNWPCPKVRVLSSNTAFPRLLGMRKSTVSAKTKDLSAWKYITERARSESDVSTPV